jgi:multidrug efflux system outer membrane protein
MKKFFLFLLFLAFFTACSFAPKYQRPDVKLPQVKTTNNKTISATWWKQFNDRNLNFLIEEALKNNDNLLLSYEKINEAAAAFNFAKANLYPNLTGSVGAKRVKTSDEASYYGKGTLYNDFNLTGDISYEVDLFGKLKNRKKTELALLLAQKSYADAVKLKLISDVANTYFEITAVNEQIKIMKNLIKRYEESYNYRKKQYKHGIVNELVVHQEKAKLDSSKLNLEKLTENRKLFINVLSLLLGKNPNEIFNSKFKISEELPQPIKIPPFLPSNVIEKRPDIIQAEENLKAANFEIGVAKAAYFPTISLTGMLGLESREMGNLIQSSAKFWNIGSNLTSTIFDFGRIKANVKIATSRQKQAIINYVLTVKNAFKEIHDAFVRLESIKKQIVLQENRVNDYKNILNISTKQYENGLIDYINVINAKRDFESSYLNLVSLKKEYLKQQVFLYKSLGVGLFAGHKSGSS